MEVTLEGAGARRAFAQGQDRAFLAGFRHRAFAALLPLLLLLPAPRLHASQFAYDQNGQLLAISNDTGNSSRYVYDSVGNLLAVEQLGAGDLAVFAFSPARGQAGTAVRVQGHGFSPEAAANAVRFGQVPAVVQSASRIALQVVVPVGATTAPITVETQGRTAHSSAAFIVEGQAQGPAPVVTQVAPLVVVAGGSVHVTGDHFASPSLQTTGRIGERYGHVTNVAATSLDLKVPADSGSGHVVIGTAFGTATSTQRVLVMPPGIDQATLAQVVSLTPGAAPTAMSVSAAGQRVAVMFDREAGDFLDLQFAGLTAGNIAFTVYDPNNKSVQSGSVRAGAPSLFLARAATRGTYLLLLRPEQPSASWTLAIDHTPVLEIDGASHVLQTAQAGEFRRYRFRATAEQRVGLGVSSLVHAGVSYGAARLQRGDGTSLASAACSNAGGGCDINLRAPANDDYLLIVEGSTTMGARVTASNDLMAVLERGVPMEAAAPRPGQNMHLLFAAQAGETLVLQTGPQLTQPANRYISYQLYRPDGTLLVSSAVRQGGTLMFNALPADGQYRLFVDPEYAATLATQLLLRVPGAGADDMPVDSSRTVSNSVPGRDVYLSFDVPDAPVDLGFALRELVLSSGTNVDVRILRPNGTVLQTFLCFTSNEGCQTNLRAVDPGRYSIIVSPRDASQSMTFRVAITRDQDLVLQRDVPLLLDVTDIGRNIRLRFQAQAGDVLALLTTMPQTQPSGKWVNYRIIRPDGTVLSSVSQRDIVTMPMFGLAQAGEYIIFVEASEGETFKTTVQLATGLQPQLQVDGQDGILQAAMPGLPVFARFAADGVSGVLEVGMTEITHGGASWRLQLLYPSGASATDGFCYTSDTACASSFRQTQAGLHGIIVRPTTLTAQLRMRATVSRQQVIELPRNIDTAVTISRPGQTARLQFALDVGDTLGLIMMQQVTSPANGRVSYSIYRADGSLFSSGGAWSHEVLVLPRVSVAGAYHLIVEPPRGATVQTLLRLTEGTQPSLLVDGPPTAVATVTGGESSYLVFDATEGQTVGIGLSDLQHTGGSSAMLYLHQPSGTYLTLATCSSTLSSGCTVRFTATATGRYRLLLRPTSAEQRLAFTVTLSTDGVGDIVRGALTPVAITRNGQSSNLGFEGTAGETITLRLKQMVVTPGGNSVQVSAYRPDGTFLGSHLSSTAPALELKNLAQTGRHRLVITPYYGGTLSAQVEYP